MLFMSYNEFMLGDQEEGQGEGGPSKQAPSSWPYVADEGLKGGQDAAGGLGTQLHLLCGGHP
jgi:hypothetical protein